MNLRVINGPCTNQLSSNYINVLRGDLGGQFIIIRND